MKLQIDPDIAAEMLQASGAIYLKGFQIKEIEWDRTYDRFEVIFEKSHLDQGQISHAAGNKLGRSPTPTPSTPPLINDGPNAADIEDAL